MPRIPRPQFDVEPSMLSEGERARRFASATDLLNEIAAEKAR